MKKSAPNRVQKVTTVLHFGTPMPARFAIWEGAPRRTTEPILGSRGPKVVQGLLVQAKICVSYKRKRRDVHDLQWRRTKTRHEFTGRCRHPRWSPDFDRRHCKSYTSGRFGFYETQTSDRKCNPWTTLGSRSFKSGSVVLRGARSHTARPADMDVPKCRTVVTFCTRLGGLLFIANVHMIRQG